MRWLSHSRRPGSSRTRRPARRPADPPRHPLRPTTPGARAGPRTRGHRSRPTHARPNAADGPLPGSRRRRRAPPCRRCRGHTEVGEVGQPVVLGTQGVGLPGCGSTRSISSSADCRKSMRCWFCCSPDRADCSEAAICCQSGSGAQPGGVDGQGRRTCRVRAAGRWDCAGVAGWSARGS